jgi:hypothetical protein
MSEEEEFQILRVDPTLCARLGSKGSQSKTPLKSSDSLQANSNSAWGWDASDMGQKCMFFLKRADEGREGRTDFIY